MTKEIVIKLVKGTNKYFVTEYKEGSSSYFAMIPLNTVSKQLKGTDLYIKEAIEIAISHLKSEIIIQSLN